MDTKNTLHAVNGNVLKAEVKIVAGEVMLSGELALPKNATGIVLFAHGSGSSRHSVRNQYVASVLQSSGIATLLFDLLTLEEEAIDSRTSHLRFDIGLLAERLIHATRWIQGSPSTHGMKIGYFGASTGGAAALVAAAVLGKQISAVVSRGGRPDLAGDTLPEVKSPTLLIVGGFDKVVIELNQQAFELLQCEKHLEIIPAASHLFEEPGKLEEVARIVSDWFARFL
ncbi:putative phosphoribosyl transferasec [mine drainage metagenome]|uniref:Putative phosphoribosyl transferasec n=1 Tax=mine drainage metagenome TaxID=410659 RepID=A0A1J5T9N8_9ZZZZ